MYYTINEAAAKRAKDANSYFDYSEGSATAAYRGMVDDAAAIAERAKRSVDPMYHSKIDTLLDTYARKLADNLNASNAIDARVPSILIAGGSNFPVRAKEKQNAARDRNMQEYMEIQGILDKMRSVGRGGIQADDPAAVEKLEQKIRVAEESQERMKAVNVYYRKHKTLNGCPILTAEAVAILQASMARDFRQYPVPYESWALTNNNANIRRMKQRVEDLRKAKQAEPKKIETADGIRVVEDTDMMRVQIFFPGKPDEAMRSVLKSNGFRWTPSIGAWQRQLNENGRWAARRVMEKLER